MSCQDLRSYDVILDGVMFVAQTVICDASYPFGLIFFA